MGKHVLGHAIHANTRAAFDRLKLGERAALVLHTYLLASVPLTDRAVAGLLGFTDLNAVRPHVTRAVDAGLLVEVGHAPCPITGRRVRTCLPTSLVAKAEPRQVLLEEVL